MDQHLWDITQCEAEQVQELMDAAGVTRPTALVLATRGIDAETVAAFLNPALQHLSDPFALPGARQAAERLWQAIVTGERILIHGDYDADGITATALTSWVLRRNGAEVDSYLPHRIDDGYGLTADSIANVCAGKCRLLLTVDCGITSYEAVRLAREHGVDVIVTDHHMPGSEPVEAHTLVDPKLPGAVPATVDLAGVGVAFKVCHAFIKYGRQNGLGGDDTDLREGLDLVALGTVADIVPLLHENRILVKHGLAVLGRQQRPGIHALCEIAGIRNDLSTADITYRLAPRLNATGRMGDPTDSLRLLESDSMVDAFALARNLDDHNRQRQQIEEEVVGSAEAQITQRYSLDQNRAIVVWNETWHQGVVGIVASRLARRYHRPAVVLTRDPSGQYTGSARSVRRLNLVDLLEQCGHSLLRFGGHAMAAGLSLEAERLPDFCRDFEAAVAHVLGAEAMQPHLEIAGDVAFGELNDAFFAELELLQPFGHGNPEPFMLTRGVSPERLLPVGRQHTKGVLRDTTGSRLPFIAFGRLPEDFPEPPWDVVYTPQINRFNGAGTVQLRLQDMRSCRS
jgi:single-stranded-DNA-specific exonuclease